MPQAEETPTELTDLDKAVLDFEAQVFRYQGVKEARIRKELGLSLTEYLIRLNILRESSAALRYAPAVVKRLQGQKPGGD